MNDPNRKRVLFVIAHEIFRDEEYQIPRDILEKNGFLITVASSSLSTAIGKHGTEVKPDILLKDAKPLDFKAVVFVGGAGCKEYWNDAQAHSLAKEFYDAGKLTTAICSAPVILANAGILQGKNATCFIEDKQHLLKSGANYIEAEVVTDGKLITANGYQASEEFAKTIVKEIL